MGSSLTYMHLCLYLFSAAVDQTIAGAEAETAGAEAETTEAEAVTTGREVETAGAEAATDSAAGEAEAKRTRSNHRVACNSVRIHPSASL